MILSGYVVIGKQKSEWRTGPLIDAVGTLLTRFWTVSYLRGPAA
jgi:hypothetical protein